MPKFRKEMTLTKESIDFLNNCGNASKKVDELIKNEINSKIPVRETRERPKAEVRIIG
jgi:hypothetical protein